MAQKMLWVQVLALIVGLVCVGNAVGEHKMGSPCSSINPTQRTECGFPGISADECKKRKCCFDSSIPNVKWCFKPPVAVAEQKMGSPCSSINPTQRTECGFAGISADECKKRKCCFDSSIRNVKWCFKPPVEEAEHKIGSPCSSINPTQRTECGFAGISADECKKRKCCFDSSIPNVKWCFTPYTEEADDDNAEYFSDDIKCDVSPAVRRECGFPEISVEECKSRNCCFDSSIRNVIWCFKASKDAKILRCSSPDIK